MKKKITIIFMLILFLFQASLLSTIVSQVDDGEGFLSFTSPDSTNSVGEGASVKSEEENIDTFDVYPSTRWSETNVGYTVTASNSLLNMTDTGDGSSDSYYIQRGLSKLDSKIEIRFKHETNASSKITSDSPFLIELMGAGSTSARYLYYLRGVKDNDYCDTQLFIHKADGTTESFNFAGDERVFEGVWYTLKIAYDLFKSKMRFRLYFDNGSRVFDYSVYDILDEDERAKIFEYNTVDVRIGAISNTANQNFYTYIDYIKAPFKGREWTQSSDAPGANWLQDRWDMAYVQDNILDTSAWDLVVPSLDSFSGAISMSFSDPDGIDDGDDVRAGIFLMGVDANDGDKHHILGIEIQQIRIDNGGLHWKTRITPFVDGSGSAIEITDNTAWPLDEEPRVSFSFSLSDDRSIAGMKLRIWSDLDDEEGFIDYVREVAVSSNVDDPSQEFIIRTEYIADFDHDIEWTAVVEDFGFIEKNIFDDFVNAIVEPLGNFLQQIFIALFRFVADIFKFVGDLIVGSILTMQTALTAAINSIQGWLVTLGTTITGAINNIQGWLNTVGAAITGAIANIEGWLSTIASTISSAVGEIAADIWVALGTAASSVMEDIIDALTTLASDVADFIDAMIQFLIPLLLAIAADLADLIVGIIDALLAIAGDILAGTMNFIAGLIFFIWEELGLPDILAVIDLFISPIIEIVTGLPTYLSDIGNLIDVFFIVILGFFWFWLIFLSFAEKGFDVFAGFGEMVNRLFTFWNLTIFGIGPIPIPIALFFIPLTYFMVLPSGSVFAIW